MKKQALKIVSLLFFITIHLTYSQEVTDTLEFDKVNPLFASQEILPVTFNYSIKELKSITNDSTYMESKMHYFTEGKWDSLDVEIRVRGNFRLNNCYYPPLKVKIRKSDRKNTIFEKDKKLKLVMPCLKEYDNNDNVIKEYLAYKLYEIVSPYHFKTRLLELDLGEEKRRKVKEHELKGFFIEDIDELVDRYDANEIKRVVHPLAQDNLCSVRYDFFQFMIGNTDFSTAYSHNGKLMFLDGATIPLPYDFDMSGLVNASYGVVSVIQNRALPINSVTDRYYRGFKREGEVFEEVRQEFLQKKDRFFATLVELKPYFTYEKEYRETWDFLQEFFDILSNDIAFNNSILARARD